MPEEPQSIIKAPQSGMQMLLFGAIGGVVLSTAVFLILGSLNLFPFSKKASQGATSPETKQPFSLGCPLLDRQKCVEGREFNIETAGPTVYALGWANLFPKTPILAIMDGDEFYQSSTVGSDGERIGVLGMRNTQEGLEAQYRFKGQALDTLSPKSKVSRGEVLGWAGDGVISGPSDKEQYHLIVTLQNMTDKTFRQLKVSDFK